MRYSGILLMLLTLCIASCQSKLDKKDISLDEMKAGDGKRYTPILADADTAPVYRQASGKDFHLNIYYPAAHTEADSSPCIIFFFGGGFVNGNPEQFAEQCRYFSDRGMVAIAADYRVISRDDCNATASLMDGKSAMRYLRSHAAELGIHPNKIVCSGGSAGGAICLVNGLDPAGLNNPDDDMSISCVPDAIVMFNPVVNFEEFEFRIRKFEGRAAELNPLTHLPATFPPSIIFHGTADEMAGYGIAKSYFQQLESLGAEITFTSFDGVEHGFYQRNKHDGKYYRETLQLTDDWLKEKGYLQ